MAIDDIGLTKVRDALELSELILDVDGSDRARRERRELIDQLDDYLLPRLARWDAPLLAVIGGSTGAGKSTLMNSLVGEDVTTAGVLRPTTRLPVLVCHPNDEEWFRGDGVLADLPRHSGHLSQRRDGGVGLEIVVSQRVSPGLALLDSPDIDSVEVANHDLAAQLLGAADLWVFVTTAMRYADAVPWEYLARARERSMALALVINRIPTGAEDEIRAHFSEMLAEHRLTGDAVFTFAEGELDGGRMDIEAAPLREWMAELAADESRRTALVTRTVDGAVRSMPDRVDVVVSALDHQSEAALELSRIAHRRYEDTRDRLDSELASGRLLAGEVLDRWQEIVGTGEFMGRLQRGVGRIRDRASAWIMGRPAAETAVAGALESNVAVLLEAQIDAAAAATVDAWSESSHGRQMLGDDARLLERGSSTAAARVEAEVTAWQTGVLELVRAEAGSKVAVARTLSVGINGVGLALMVAVFSQTGGLTGGEAAVAGGAAALSQTVLSAVFGEQAIRELVARSRRDLRDRFTGILDEEVARFDTLLADLPAVDLSTYLADAVAPARNGVSVPRAGQ